MSERRSERRRSIVVTLIGCCLVSGLILTQAAAAAPKLPNLVVRSVTLGAAKARPGGTLVITDTTANTGTAAAGASVTGYYLSSDGKKSAGAVHLGGTRTVPSLRPGASSKGTAKVTLPRYTPTGTYTVLACADDTGRVKEKNEADNCRAAGGKLTITAHPLTVHIRLDRRHAVSTTVNTDLGQAQTVSTKDAAGNAFSLTLPVQALLSPERITLTPIRSISGSGLTRPVIAGVDIQPSGLILNQPATLTVVPKHSLPISQQHAFAANGTGRQFHRYPLDPTRKAIVLDLTHFSSYDLGMGSDSSIITIQDDTPAMQSYQLENTLAGPEDAYRDGAITHGDLVNILVDPVEKYFEGLARNLIQAETIDLGNDEAEDQVVRPAVIAAISFARQMTLLGMEDRYAKHIAFIQEELLKIEAHSFNLSYERCLKNQQPREQLIDMMVAWRQLTLQNAEGKLGADAWNKVKHCAGDYQLFFSGNSQTEGHTTWSQEVDFKKTGVSVHADNMPLRLDTTFQFAGAPTYRGNGPLSVDSVSSQPWNTSCDQPRGIWKAEKGPQKYNTLDATFYPDINAGVEAGLVDRGTLYLGPSDNEAAVSDCNGVHSEVDILNFFAGGYGSGWAQASHGAIDYPGFAVTKEGKYTQSYYLGAVFTVHFTVTVTPVE
jgi:CARDB